MATIRLSKQFEQGLRTLNAHLWMLVVLCEQTSAEVSQLSTLDGLPHEKILPALFPLALKHIKRLRVKDKSLTKDVVDLTDQIYKWLPAYFLILGKSLAEGLTKDHLWGLYSTDLTFKEKVEKRRKYNRRSPTKEVEVIAQTLVRGAFPEVKDVFDITIKWAAIHGTEPIDSLSKTLDNFSKLRNRLAHNLIGEYRQTKTLISDQELTEYLSHLQVLIEIIE